MSDDVTSLILRVDSSPVRDASDDLDRLSSQSKKTSDDVNAFGKKSNTAFGLAAKGAALLATAISSIKLAGAVSDTISLANEFNSLGISLNVIAKNAGVSRKEIDDAEKGLRSYGISLVKTRSSLQLLILGNIQVSKSLDLARAAQDTGRIAMENSSETFQRFVEAISTGNSELLKSVGVMVDFEAALKSMADELGVSKDDLTEQERVLARTNELLRKTSGAAGVYEESLKDVGGQLRSLDRQHENLGVRLGQLFTPAISIAVQIYTDLIKQLNKELEDLTESGTITAWGNEVRLIFAGVADGARVLAAALSLPATAVNQLISIAKGDIKGAAAQGDAFLNFAGAVIGDPTKFQDQTRKLIADQKNAIEEVKKETDSAFAPPSSEPRRIGTTTKKTNGVDERKKFIESVREETASLGLNQVALLREQAARLGISAQAEKDIVALENKIFLLDLEESGINEARKAESERAARLASAQQEASRVFLESATAGERFAAQLENINRLEKEGLEIDKADILRGDALKKLVEFGEKGKDEFSELEMAAQRWGRSSADAVAEFAVSGASSFKNFAGAVIKELIAIAVQQRITGPLFKSFGDALSGISFGVGSSAVPIPGIKPQGRANGGAVSGGIFEVNERGEPEILNSGNRQFLLMPQGSSGNVQPVINPSGGSGGSGGGGQGQREIKVNIIEAPGKGGEVQQRETPQGVELDVMLDQLVAKKQSQRNSAQNRSLRQNFGLGEPLVAR